MARAFLLLAACAPGKPCLLADGSAATTVGSDEQRISVVPLEVVLPSRVALDGTWLDGDLRIESQTEQTVNVAISDCEGQILQSFELGGSEATAVDLKLWREVIIDGCGRGADCRVAVCLGLRSAPGTGPTSLSVASSASLWGLRQDACAPAAALSLHIEPDLTLPSL